MVARTLKLPRDGGVGFNRLVRRDYGVETTCRNGLRAANTATAPIKAKLVVAMPRRRERIQPLTPKLPRRNTTPPRNNIESSAICESAAKFDTLNSLGSLAARTAPNVIPSVTGKKATEAIPHKLKPRVTTDTRLDDPPFGVLTVVVLVYRFQRIPVRRTALIAMLGTAAVQFS